MRDQFQDPTSEVAHRPWALPRAPWVMSQRWNDLLFAHWPVPESVMRSLVPKELPLDCFDGSAWLTIAPFQISHLGPRGMRPVPGFSAFPELNVRTYVTLDDRPGVWFFSLDAGSWLAVIGARAFYHLAYFHASMIVRSSDDEVEYHSRRKRSPEPTAELNARYGPRGLAYRADAGTLDHWLTERYCLYAMDSARRIYRAEIHHRPWSLQPAFAEFKLNTMDRVAGLHVSGEPARLSFTKKIDVAVWWPELVRR